MKHITPAGIRPPFARYSYGVEIPPGNRILVCSGQLGITAQDHIPATVEEQTHLCFRNIKAVLEEAGFTFSNVVRINAFVDQPVHAWLAVNEFFIGQIIRGKRLGRKNIFRNQPRMIGHDLFRRHPSSQLSEDDLDGHARSPDHRLSAHDLRIDFNSLVVRHRAPAAFRVPKNTLIAIRVRYQHPRGVGISPRAGLLPDPD